MHFVTPKAAAKHELLFNKLASSQQIIIKMAATQQPLSQRESKHGF
jgi:hypothetical protein